MMSYSLRLLDLSGTMAGTRDVRVRDDLDALDEAVRQSGVHEVEIWQGPRLVARVKPGNADLNAADTRSL